MHNYKPKRCPKCQCYMSVHLEYNNGKPIIIYICPVHGLEGIIPKGVFSPNTAQPYYTFSTGTKLYEERK